MTIITYITDIRASFALGDVGELVALLRDNPQIQKDLVDSIIRQNSYVYLVKETYDGWYCVEDKAGWIVYEQERGRIEYGPIKYKEYCSALGNLIQLSGYFG